MDERINELLSDIASMIVYMLNNKTIRRSKEGKELLHEYIEVLQDSGDIGRYYLELIATGQTVPLYVKDKFGKTHLLQ